MIFEVYTDGATSNNGKEDANGGWAYAVFSEESNKPLWFAAGHIDNATNNICELTAAIEACRFLINEITPFDTIHIYTDSAYLYNCYKDRWYAKWEINGWVNSKKEPVKNKELWKELIKYFEYPEFRFHKVKGHSTNVRNNLVDSLAVQAKEKREDN